ncbi:MAG TPA: hypothetical protein VE396_00970 [Xanthobacteraceae bacterium]|nr:hypothetical protein [Xanthobacteraceae bacterium]
MLAIAVILIIFLFPFVRLLDGAGDESREIVDRLANLERGDALRIGIGKTLAGKRLCARIIAFGPMVLRADMFGYPLFDESKGAFARDRSYF